MKKIKEINDSLIEELKEKFNLKERCRLSDNYSPVLIIDKKQADQLQKIAETYTSKIIQGQFYFSTLLEIKYEQLLLNIEVRMPKK